MGSSGVEMYNMDHESKIDKLDDNTYNSLIEEKYLNPNGVKPLLPICKYLSRGNLATDTGIIYCECHGDIEGKIKGKYDESQISREYNKIKFKNQFRGFFYLIFFSSLFVLVSRFLFPDFLKSLKILVFAFVLMILLLLGISWLSYLLG